MKDPLLEALGLKSVDRAGWVRVGVEGAESVAAHSWGMSLLVLLLLPPDLDRERALAYAVLHDLAEAWVGDLTPQDDTSDKLERETAAMQAFCERVARPDLLQTWLDYENQVDAEARFVKQLDRLDMGLQAAIYARQGLDLNEFRESALAGIQDPELAALLES